MLDRPVNHRLKNATPIDTSDERIADTLWMGHQAEDVAPMAADASDILKRAIRVRCLGNLALRLTITKKNLSIGIKYPQCLLIGKIASLTMSYGQAENFPFME